MRHIQILREPNSLFLADTTTPSPTVPAVLQAAVVVVAWRANLAEILAQAGCGSAELTPWA